jgi:hypothetical protein
MKWPLELLLIRHAESAYNNLKTQKDADPDYRQFRALLENDPLNPEVQAMAIVLHKKHALGCSDRDTPITPMGKAQARTLGAKMRESGVNNPRVIFVSPYVRTEQTLDILQEEWPALRNTTVYRKSESAKKTMGSVFSTTTRISTSFCIRNKLHCTSCWETMTIFISTGKTFQTCGNGTCRGLLPSLVSFPGSASWPSRTI